MNSNKKIIDNIDDETLLDLVQQSFSVNGLSVLESKELANAMFLEKNFTEIPSIKSNEPLKVYLTHDIDWIYPFHSYSILKTFFSNRKWLSVSQLFQSNIYLKNIEKLLAFEKEQNVKSVFNVGANNSTYSLGRYDIRYTNNNFHFKKLLEILTVNQFEIGLHSDVNISINKQISLLAKVLERDIKYHRSHFYHFNPLTLWNELDGNGIKVDFSVGNAREVGFKNGMPRHYRAIDFVNKKVLNTTIVPTILSDNAFFFHDKFFVFNHFIESIKSAKQFGASVAILFHPENMIVKPELWEYYEEIIHICKSEGALFN